MRGMFGGNLFNQNHLKLINHSFKVRKNMPFKIHKKTSTILYYNSNIVELIIAVNLSGVIRTLKKTPALKMRTSAVIYAYYNILFTIIII